MWILLLWLATAAALSEPDWSSQASLPPEGHRANIYQMPEPQWQSSVEAGLKHVSHYPVTVTGLLVPWRPLERLLNSDDQNPVLKIIMKFFGRALPFRTLTEMWSWMGLVETPDSEYPLGVTIQKNVLGEGLTFSCASCHASELFGKPVIGLANRHSRANLFFHRGKEILPKIPGRVFQVGSGATSGERKLYQRSRANLARIGVVIPQALGLDTSLAQVALSLARRQDDAYATPNKKFEKNPRQNALESVRADSKPATWWNLKYKTRWLADGSVISGNPIITNFLWNELGRGTDLHELETWLAENLSVVRELTSAVFATPAPRWENYLPASWINIERAKKGESVFNQSCAGCHGVYIKEWAKGPSSDDDDPGREQLRTLSVHYPSRTRVINVGTDPLRYQGMAYFSDALNALAISQKLGIQVTPQQGYVPPPLEGIWARYPYMHNNSIPNLCALMQPQAERPAQFYMGPTHDPATDFDAQCVGYPTGDRVPQTWRNSALRVDTRLPGVSNAGHTSPFYNADGSPRLSHEEKSNLLEYLKTL